MASLIKQFLELDAKRTRCWHEYNIETVLTFTRDGYFHAMNPQVQVALTSRKYERRR